MKKCNWCDKPSIGSYCSEEHELKCKAYLKAYHQSDKHKAYKKAYHQSDKYKAYMKSDKHKAYMKAYRQSDKFKACLKVYYQSDKYKAYEKVRAKKDHEQSLRNKELKRKQKELAPIAKEYRFLIRLEKPTVRQMRRLEAVAEYLGRDIDEWRNEHQKKEYQGLME